MIQLSEYQYNLVRPHLIKGEIASKHPKYTSYIITSIGRVFSLLKYKFLIPHDNGIGYLQVFLIPDEDGRKNHWQKIHRLVLEAFVCTCPGEARKIWVNHKNGLKQDNRVENLEWMTGAVNHQHAVDVGLRIMPKGPDHWRSGKKASESTRKIMSEKRKLYWEKWRYERN